MGGERRDIAKVVVNVILDTLGDNDFVNVYRFSDTTEELVPCFKDMLVQVTQHTATLRPCGLFNPQI
jgi:voltage-dependent calcium channel alpha-2/delta-3